MHSRFTALPGFGDEELEKLQNSTAAVVGLGATGSVIAEHLARHGVKLLLVDRDYLEEKDLYTSNIYTREQVEEALPKAEAARQKLSSLTEVWVEVANLDSGNISMLDSADIVLDGTDNLETRFLINEYSKKNGKPWIYTAALGEKPYSMFFKDRCFSCVFEEVEAGQLDTCETSGIMREASALAATRSAWKAVRYLAGKDASEKFETFPGGSFEVESPGCKVCERGEYERLESMPSKSRVCGENKYQLEKNIGEKAFQRLQNLGNVKNENDYLVRAEAEGREIVIFKSGRAIVEAPSSEEAEAFFDRFIGS